MTERRVVNYTKTGRPVRHGSTTAYTTHGCRCPACTGANTARCERRKLERFAEAAAGTATFEHGVSGYNNWGCGCKVCSDAWAENERHRRATRIARNDQAPHGTESGYIAWGCRCDPCKTAGSRARKERRAKAKDGAVTGATTGATAAARTPLASPSGL